MNLRLIRGHGPPGRRECDQIRSPEELYHLRPQPITPMGPTKHLAACDELVFDRFDASWHWLAFEAGDGTGAVWFAAPPHRIRAGSNNGASAFLTSEPLELWIESPYAAHPTQARVRIEVPTQVQRPYHLVRASLECCSFAQIDHCPSCEQDLLGQGDGYGCMWPPFDRPAAGPWVREACDEFDHDTFVTPQEFVELCAGWALRELGPGDA